jgi:hypothetical protein
MKNRRKSLADKIYGVVAVKVEEKKEVKKKK